MADDSLSVGIDSVIERLMARTHAASGQAIFVDRHILRTILEGDLRWRFDQLAEQRKG